MSNTVTAHPAFESIRQQDIESLNIRIEQYEHRATGAVHYHLASENSENVFLVALRTVPHDSTGVAHILEHTALCGSERFPVRDPFFMMLRRSLNTFMNAFTSSDWTAYPFASQNRKDFDNLLDVYLDAVFFSRLDPLDFAQEGHRVEFAEHDNPDSELVFKGVVFNEMKGAMSAISSVLWQKLCEHLFTTSTYHYNSGGDPVNIPDLSYQGLRDFYASHYHPTNAIFMTFGNIDAAEHQQVFQEKALQRFERLDERIEVAPEQRFDKPLSVTDTYAYDENDELTDKTHLVVGWMLGESADLEQLLEAQLLSSVLLDNSASPLQHALETTELGRAPSPLCGLEDGMREMVFCCGIEGSEAEHAEALEALVLSVIEQVAEEGVSEENLEAVLHQLELHQREISGDSYPYGLQLILQAIGSATHYSDPIAVLNLDPVIDSLREKIRDPGYIRELAKRLLLDNPHRVTLTLAPDQALSGQRADAERARLDDIKKNMDAADREATVQLAADLLARQAQEDDESILPKVQLTDVPANLPEPVSAKASPKNLPFTSYATGTNGLVYQQAIAALPQLSKDQLRTLPLYSGMLTELGLGSNSYMTTQQRQAATVGSISAMPSLRSAAENEQVVSGFFTVSSKALARNAQAQTQLMFDTLQEARFDETSRIRELINQARARREQGITGNGHVLAMTAASAGMSPIAALSHEQSGLAGIRTLRALDDSLNDKAALQTLSEELAMLHQSLRGAPLEFLVVAEKERIEQVMSGAASIWAGHVSNALGDKLSLDPVREQRGELWLTNTQVNFCAKAYPTVPIEHVDAAALTVLGGVLRNGFLHRAIREQGGAYGGGASQDSGIASFRFYSYRDPRLAETLADFDAAIDWMLTSQHDQRVLEEAILGVIGSLDKPGSPAGEAKQNFHNKLFGRSHAQREVFRQSVLGVTLEDLLRVTQTYLQPELASTAAIAPIAQADATAELRERLGLSLQEL